MIDREEVLNILKANREVNILFIKLDGTERDMRCTLHPDVIPLTGSEETTFEGDNVVVYDLDKQGWRSFILENLISVEVP